MKIAPTAIVFLLLLPGLSLAQQEADYVVDGVTYYTTAGTVDTGHMAKSMDFTGGSQYDFFGCAHGILRPDKNHGIVTVTSLVEGNFFQLYMNQFEGDLPGMSGGISRDVYVDGSRTHDGIQHPAVFAGIAAWGKSELQLGRNPFLDPVTGEDLFKTSFFVTPNAFRDNTTGLVLTQEGLLYEPGTRAALATQEYEMHLRVESPGGAKQPPWFNGTRAPAGPGYMTPTEAYAALYPVPNQRFGGTMTVEVESTAVAMAGENEITFHVRAPNGTILDSATVAPALGAPAEATMEVPLESFGVYLIDIQGRVSLSDYTLTVTQNTPDVFDMSFWWDNVTFGGYSTVSKTECEERVGSPEGSMVARIIERPPPPPFEWIPIVFGTLGAIVTILVGIKITALVVASMRQAKLGEA